MVVETPPPQALHSRTTRAFLLGRSFMVDDDPAPTVEQIKRTLKLYPYAQGGFGTSVATLLEGQVRPDPPAQIPETVFVEGSGKSLVSAPEPPWTVAVRSFGGMKRPASRSWS